MFEKLQNTDDYCKQVYYRSVVRPTRREDLRCGERFNSSKRSAYRIRWGTLNHQYTSEHFAKAQLKLEDIWSVGFDVRTNGGLDYQIRIWI